MHDAVGERLRRQTAARRKDKWQYLALYSFLGANLVFIAYKLITL